MKIMIVSRDSDRGSRVVDRLQSLLGDKYDVFGCYRDYHAEIIAEDCFFILGDGTCKTYIEESGGICTIFYSSLLLALKNKVPYLPMFTCNPLTAWIVAIIIYITGKLSEMSNKCSA